MDPRVKPAGDRNAYPSARNGRVNNVSVASSTLARPARMSTTALAIGMSTPFALAISTSTGAVKMPSASAPPACAGSSPPRALPLDQHGPGEDPCGGRPAGVRRIAPAERHAVGVVARLRARAGEDHVA